MLTHHQLIYVKDGKSGKKIARFIAYSNNPKHGRMLVIEKRKAGGDFGSKIWITENELVGKVEKIRERK